MPLMTTRGALSARGYGLFGNPRRWVTVTFTANATWTCPAGVSSVNLSGYGSAGLSDYGAVATYPVFAVPEPDPNTQLPNPPYADWGSLFNNVASIAYDFSSAPGYFPSYAYDTFLVSVSGSYWGGFVSYTADYSTTWVTGMSYTPDNNPQTTGIITYAQLQNGAAGWNISIHFVLPGNAGTAATGFGDSFPGGVYSGTYPYGIAIPPVTTTFANVAVTPTTGYPLVVPAGGSISISYLI